MTPLDLWLCAAYAFAFVVILGAMAGYVALVVWASWDTWAQTRERYAGPDRWE